MTVLMVGLDEAWDRAAPADVLAYGAGFVARYVGEDISGKNLSLTEAQALSAAGLSIVTNYEYAAGAARKGRTEGIRVARLADTQHRAAGGPDDRPIYFSVDFDATAADLSAVGAYFDGIASVLGRARTGGYGEYTVVRYLFDTGRISYGWQTYAWSAGQWDPRAQIRQVANGIHVAGHDVDRDEASTLDVGQWQAGGGDMWSDQQIRDILDAVGRIDGALAGGHEPAPFGYDRGGALGDLLARPVPEVKVLTDADRAAIIAGLAVSLPSAAELAAELIKQLSGP